LFVQLFKSCAESALSLQVQSRWRDVAGHGGKGTHSPAAVSFRAPFPHLRLKNKTSTPVNSTGVYPHMPIADHRETHIIYNTGRHRPSWSVQLYYSYKVQRWTITDRAVACFSQHTRYAAVQPSLSHRANDRGTCYRFFNF